MVLYIFIAGLWGVTPRDSHGQAVPDSTSLALAPTAAALALAPTAAAGGVRLPKLGGYIQARQVAQKDVGLTALLNRARFSIDGALPDLFLYRLLVETETSAGVRLPATVSLREAILRWNPAPFGLTAGEFKTPFTREYLIPVPALELADLATVIDSLAPKYDVGVMGDCALGAFATIQAGVFNGEGANAIANRDSTVLYVGRVTARPIPQLGLGASATHEGGDSLRWGVDGVVQQWGGMVRAEHLTRHVRGRAQDEDDFGWYVLEAFRVIPRVQLVARQEDFQRPLRGIASRQRCTAYATNIEIVPYRIRLLLEFSRRISGKLQTRSDSFIAQLQAQF
jgi:hypothetical protein